MNPRFFFHAGFSQNAASKRTFSSFVKLDAVTMYGRICFGLSSHFFP